MIDELLFADRVAQIWRSRGLHETSGLRQAWWLFARTLNNHAQNKSGSHWDVIALPTGCGKTLCTAVYCAMLAENYGLVLPNDGPGVLIVSPLIAQADEITETINNLSSTQAALACHSKQRIERSVLAASSIVCSTHAALLQGMDAIAEGKDETSGLDHLLAWQHTRRGLIIVDEAIRLERSYRVSGVDLSALSSMLPKFLTEKQVAEFDIDALNRCLPHLLQNCSSYDRVITKPLQEWMQGVDLFNLYSVVQKVQSGALMLPEKGSIEKHNLRSRFLHNIEQLQGIKRIGTSFLSKDGNTWWIAASEPTFGCGSLTGVILDATATVDVRYQIAGTAFNVVRPQHSLRKYDRVTVHVARANVGKCSLKKNAKSEWPHIRRSIESGSIPLSDTLIVCHKEIEDTVIAPSIAGNNSSVGHWHALTGLNRWMSSAAILIYGLPYLNPLVLRETYTAYTDEHAMCVGEIDRLERSIICRDVIQAINRARCRNLTDAEGRCDPTSVFIILPPNAVGDAVIDALTTEMPGIVIKGWEDLSLSGRRRKSTPVDTFMVHLAHLPSGSHDCGELRKHVGLPRTTYQRFIREAQKPGTEMSRFMLRHSLSYESARGRNGSSLLHKAPRDPGILAVA